MKKLIAVVLVIATFALAGCNTMHGFGKDVEKVGEKLSNTGPK